MSARIDTPGSNTLAGQPARAAAPPGTPSRGRNSSLNKTLWRSWNSFLLWWHPVSDEARSRSRGRHRPNNSGVSRRLKTWRKISERFWNSASGRRCAVLLERFYAWWYPVSSEPSGHPGYSVRRRKSRPGIVWHSLKCRVRTLPRLKRLKTETDEDSVPPNGAG